MRINTPARIALTILALVCLIYGYGAWKFEKRVKTFNLKIREGDSSNSVCIQMGRPSHVLSEYATLEQVGHGQEKGTARTILWVYSGSLYFRNDLSLIFDRDTGKLINKNRVNHLIEHDR